MATKMLLACMLALSFSVAVAQIPVADFCVADPKAQALVNGVACKDPKAVTVEDFFFTGSDKPGNTSNPLGSKVTPFSVTQIPGLNTFGLSLVRVDFAPGGVNAPHIHPRAAEIFTVLEGSIEVGFISSNPELRHFTKVLQKGDVFVFPLGLVHYQKNIGNTPAVAMAALNSQNGGMVPVGATLLHATPSICTDIVSKALQLENDVVKKLQSKQ